GFEPETSSLPRMRSTPELLGRVSNSKTIGAGDETRTRDIQLGRLTLYQLSYSRPCGFWILDLQFWISKPRALHSLNSPLIQNPKSAIQNRPTGAWGRI